jgi:hypothetical protein
MTPVDANHTKYYWFQMRNFAPDDAEISTQFAKSVRGAFDEDRAVLSAVYKGLADMRTPKLDLKIDVGPMRFRHNLAKLIAAESTDMAAD